MAGGKIKSGSKHKNNKGKRWKKGHSSESNPITKKHRESAKNKFFNVNTGVSGLTVDAIAKHDAANTEEEMAMGTEAGSDAHSIGGASAKTFKTWATNWTECTNATFGKVHRYWSSNSALHKEILAVLAAVTEIIKEKGGTESETDYFAALMTTLETVEEEQSVTAVMYLLSLAVKRVPASVMKSRFSDISKTFLNLLGTYTSTGSPALLKSLLLCLAQLLRVQEQAMWSNSSTTHVYNGILVFIAHPKPRVRQSAQQAVRIVLKASTFMIEDNAPPCHPAASTTAKYCIQLIEDSGGSNESSGTLYTLGLLQHILGHFPQNSLKSTCETILRVMTLSNVIVTSVAMKALHGMFMSQPKANCLSAELNAQIITALYDYQPGENDIQPTSAWLAVMEVAHINLRRLNEQLCASHLPRIYASCMKCMQSDRQDVYTVTAKTLTNLTKECIGPSAELFESMYKHTPQNTASPVHKLTACICAGLGYQYHAAWKLMFRIITAYIEVLGKQCAPLMKKCLQSMCDLRESFGFTYQTELDYAVGMAVSKMGPRQVLQAAPLHITGDEDNFDFPRSWLLPVLRDHVKETELAYFTTYFLPLAAKLRTKSIEFANEKQIAKAKTYDALQLQVWSLLPAFCTKPTDLCQSFKGLAKILGTALTDRPDIRMDLLASLRKLVLQNLDNEINKAEMSKYAKNYLPLLFNLYTLEPEKQGKDPTREAMLATVKIYMQIAEVQVINSFFDKCVGKLLEDDVSTFRRHALMDLCCVMVMYVDSQRLKKVYKLVTSQFKSTDRTIQKKSYRILESLCCSTTSQCQAFIKSHLTDLQNHLLESLSSSSPASKAPRLRCLVHIVTNLSDPNMEFLVAVVPEAILCTKEIAEKARTASYNLLVEIGNTVMRWSGESISDQEQAILGYFELVMAGLAGSPHMLSCTVLAITRIIYEFKDKIGSELLSMLVENACLLLKSKAREVVMSALGLIKVMLTIFPDTTLASHLKLIVSSLVSMKENSKHHFRFKNKEIFTRLIRKFGAKIIQGMVPEKDTKWLNSMRKEIERNKKKKKEGRERTNSEGDESHDEQEFTTKHSVESIDDLLKESDSEPEEENPPSKGNIKNKEKSNKKSTKGAAWLKETGDDIVDFMDPSVSKKVLATKPEPKSDTKTPIKHDFKMAADGRLIITADADETEKATGNSMKKRNTAEDDEEDIDDLLEALGGPGSKSKSRKRKMTVEDLPDKDHMSMVSSNYKPGGRGIHRSLANKKLKTDNTKTSGTDYKAKKAGGDIKKDGKHDPYAYIPLQRTTLNRRKKAKNKGQFKNFVRGAKKGALKGSKLKSKSRSQQRKV